MRTLLILLAVLGACRRDPGRAALARALGLPLAAPWSAAARAPASDWEGLLLHEVSFSDAERKGSALLLKPAGDGPFPAVLFLHGALGGAEEAVGVAAPGRQGPGARLLAARGFAVLVPKLSYGKRAPSPRAVDEARRALIWLRGQKDVDARRLGVAGWGAGATAAAVLTALDVRLRAAYLSGAAGKFDGAGGWGEVLRLAAPRPVFIEMTEENPYTDAATVRARAAAARAHFPSPELLQLAVYPGSYRYLGTTAPDWFALHLR